MADIDNLIDAVQDLTNSLSRTSGPGPSGYGREAVKMDPGKAANMLAAGLTGITARLTDFSASTTTATEATSKMASVFESIPGIGLISSFTGIGIAAGMVVAAAENLYGSWKDLYNVGAVDGMQSLTQLSAMATNSYQSLESFTESVTKSGKVVAQIGLGEFVKLQTGMRLASREFGGFGRNIREQNEELGDYLETQRSLGAIENINTNQAINSMMNLNKTTSALSRATGRSRDEILKNMRANTQSSTSLYAALKSLPEAQRQAAQAQSQEAMAVFASLGQEAGATLSSMLGDTLASGSASLAKDMQGLQGHIPNVVRNMDELGRAVKAGTGAEQASIKVVNSLKNLNSDQIRVLAQLEVAGDDAAGKILKLMRSTEGFNSTIIEAARANAKNFTQSNKFFGNFGQNMEIVTGQFKKIFMTVLEPILSAFDSTSSDSFTDFSTWLSEWVDKEVIPSAKKFGDWLAKDVPQWIADFKSGFGTLVKNIQGFFNFDDGKDKDKKEEEPSLVKKFFNWINGIFSDAEKGSSQGVMATLGSMFSSIAEGIGNMLLGEEIIIPAVQGASPGEIQLEESTKRVGGLFANIFGQERWDLIKKIIDGFMLGISNTFSSMGDIKVEDIAKQISDIITTISDAMSAIPSIFDNFISMFSWVPGMSDDLVKAAEERIEARELVTLEKENKENFKDNTGIDKKSLFGRATNASIKPGGTGGFFNRISPEENRIQLKMADMIRRNKEDGIDKLEMQQMLAALEKMGAEQAKATSALRFLADMKPQEMNSRKNIAEATRMALVGIQPTAN